MLHRFAARFLSFFKGNEKKAVRGREIGAVNSSQVYKQRMRL